MYEEYQITSRQGFRVNVRYSENPFGGDNAIGLRHFEFRSNATSETGYRSHFFYQTELDNTNIRDYVKKLVEELIAETKYNPVKQLSII